MRFHHFPLLLALLALLVLPFTAPAEAVNGTWRNLGPDGGSVYSLVSQPGNPRVMYAGVEGGAYKSVDGGATWTEASRGFGVASPVSSFAFDAANRSTVYASQGEGVFRSDDAGQSWSLVGPRNAGAFEVAAHPTVSGTVYAATMLGLYRSTDFGLTWKLQTRGLPKRYRAFLVAVDPSTPSRLYIVIEDVERGGGGLFRSDNGGSAWFRVHERTPSALAFDPRAPRTLYAAFAGEIFRSTNAGKSWKRLGTVAASRIETLTPDPARPNVLYAGGQHGLFRSQDGGRSWTQLFTGLPQGVFHAIVVSPTAPQTLFTGVFSDRRGGVYQSTDGGATWRLGSRGLSAMQLRSLAVHPRTPGVLWAVANSFLFQSTDGGAAWVRKRPDTVNSLVSRVFLDPVEGSTVFALLQGGGLRRSVDGGLTWEAAGVPSVGLSLLVFDPQTPSTLYAVGGGLAKSTDRGDTWTTLPGDASRMAAFDLVISPNDPSTLYAAGYVAGQPGILRSTDAGATWTRADSGFQGFPQTLAIDPLVPTTVFGAGGHVSWTTNGGNSWSVFSDAFKERTVFPLATSPETPNLLYAGVWFDNVYQIATGGNSWERLGESPGRVAFMDLVPDPTSACRLYAATNTRGLLVFTRSGCVD